MENEITKYRDKQAIEHADKMYDKEDESADAIRECDLWDNRQFNFKEGFNAAIALDLPIRFSEWRDENFYCFSESNGKKFYPKSSSKEYDILKLIEFNPQRKITLSDLYKYWVENILKL